MSKKTKATHSGTCQVCGRNQKLPGGKLSIHGYTIHCGFFEGICKGTEHLPFEQDFSLVAGAIKAAEAQAECIRAVQAQLRAPVPKGVTKAWVNVYFTYTNKWNPSRYEWREVEVMVQEMPLSEGRTYLKLTRDKVEGEFDCGVHNRSWSAGYGNTYEQGLQSMNSSKADSMNRTLKEIAAYVSWQKKRIQDWKPMPLKELK